MMETTISKLELQKISNQVFANRGISKEIAKTIFNFLWETELAGHPSHGFSRLKKYTKDLDTKIIDPNTRPQILKSYGSTISISGEYGFGILTALYAMEKGIERAKELGISLVTIQKCNDIARVGGYLQMATEQGLIALIFVNDGGANPSVAPHPVFKPFFSTNPMAIGFPTNGSPIIIDMATSGTAIGKIRESVAMNKELPRASLVDSRGKELKDGTPFFEDPTKAMIPPLGYPFMGHKGFALSLMVELLAGGLTGAGVCDGRDDHRDQNGVTMIVIDPRFMMRDATFESYVERLKCGLNTIDSEKKIRLPGAKRNQEKNEIKIRKELLEELHGL